MNSYRSLGILFLFLASLCLHAQAPKNKPKHTWYYGFDGGLGCLGLSKDNP